MKPGSKLELMIKKYVQPSYDVMIESYPAGCCNSCQQNMYRCKKAEDSGKLIEPHKEHEWNLFSLEIIHTTHLS